MKMLVLVAAGVSLLSLAFPLKSFAGATTFAELQTAVSAAASGSTVYVDNDMEFDSALSVPDGKSVTIEGTDGVAYRLTRASGYAEGTFFSVEGTATHGLTIKNLVIDFNCPTGTKLTSRGFSIAGANSTLTLGSGAKLCNAHQDSNTPGFIRLNNGKLYMEDGAEISNIRNDGWACAIRVGNNNNPDASAFIMNGGLITDCHDLAKASGTSVDLGGIVYVHRGKFYFNGGSIVGNTSENYSAGVVLDQGGGSAVDGNGGILYAGGHGVITGNVGKVSNDVFCRNEYNVWIINTTGIGNTTLYDGAVFTVKPKYDEALGSYSKCCGLRSGSDISVVGIGNISLQDDPTAVCGETFGSSTSRYYPMWVKKTAEARTADRLYTRPSLKTLFGLVNGKAATITLFDDVTWTESSAYDPGAGADWLLKSADAAERHVIKLASSATGFLSLATGDSAKKVRLENIVVDGNADGGAKIAAKGGLFYLPTGATLELGSGATITNVASASEGSAVHAVGSAQVRMEDGAEISGCSGTWGMALLLGNKKTPQPTFDMTGGRITACRCTYASSSNGDAGGAVYLYGATMNMSGGEITGNTAVSGGTVGVHLENASHSSLNLSGTAKIYGNPGLFPDIYVYNYENTISFSGDFRGLVALGKDSVDPGISAASGATGAWCFYRSATDGTCNGKWGYLENNVVRWSNQVVGTVDGYGFVQASDLAVRLGDAEDLSTPAARQALPHVLTGAALITDITQTLTFDSKEMLNSGELPLCLYTGDFAGSVNITTPVEGRLRWKVTKQTVNGICGLYLERDPYGLAVFIR